MTERMEDELLGLLDADRFVAFVEAFGGARLYIPKRGSEQIEAVIGKEASDRLSRHFGGVEPAIPLAKLYRAKIYRGRGESNAVVARRLGMTEKGVEKLFRRTPTERPTKRVTRRHIDPRQLRFFD